MKKSTLLWLLFTGWYAGIVAQEARPVTISGQIKSDKDSIRLIVWFGKDPVVGIGEEMVKIPVLINPNGSFSFTTPAISQFARLEIFDARTGNFLFTRDQQFIAPADNITLTGNIQDNTTPNHFKATFSGNGAAKFECIQALKSDTRLSAVMSIAKDKLPETIALYDSVLQAKQAIVKKHKLSKDEHAMIMADLTSELKWYALMNICGYNAGSIHSPKPNAESLAQQKIAFEALMAHLKDTVTNDAITARSSVSRKYFLHKARAEQVFANNSAAVTLTQLFNRLRDRYKGAVRDKLLGYLLLNPSENFNYFGGIDPSEQLQCLQAANGIIQSDEIRERIKKSLAVQVKGAPAYNFTLPVDSSENRQLSLSDFKGKVVLLDLWSYQCTGCVVFSNTFHKKIYPTFQNNPDFAVVSIMLDEFADKNKYMYRLRRGGGVTYTFPDYINLYGGREIAAARAMEKYHAIDAYPTIMLIDKHGRIYSSTLPVIYGDPRIKELETNQQKFINLIQQALSEPAVQKPDL